MKIRTGFVSNSSSSSFVIAGNSFHLKNGYLNVQIKLNELINEIIEDEAHLAVYFEHHYGKSWRENSELLVNNYNAALIELQSGNAIAIGRISSDGFGAEPMFYDNPEMFESAIEDSSFKLINHWW